MRPSLRLPTGLPLVLPPVQAVLALREPIAVFILLVLMLAPLFALPPLLEQDSPSVPIPRPVAGSAATPR